MRRRPSVDGYRWTELAHYNSEKGRGLIHDRATDARMAVEQAAFDREQVDRMVAEGWTQDGHTWTSPSMPRIRWWHRWRSRLGLFG